MSLVVSDGSWLLLDKQAWNDISSLADGTWFIDVGSTSDLTRIAHRPVCTGPGQEKTRALARADAKDILDARKIQWLLLSPPVALRVDMENLIDNKEEDARHEPSKRDTIVHSPPRQPSTCVGGL